MAKQDMKNANVKAPPPIVTVLYIAMAYLLGWLIHLPIAVPGSLRIFGFALTVIGFLFGIGALVAFRKARTTLDPRGSATALVEKGVYQFTRNPIYLGFLLMVIGLPLNSGLYWGILMAPFFVVTINRLVIEKEEAYLENKFKDQYTSYKSRVRRWL